MAAHRARPAVAKQFCVAVASLAMDTAAATALLGGQGLGLDGHGVCREVCAVLRTHMRPQSQPAVPVPASHPGQRSQDQSPLQQQGGGGCEGVVLQALVAVASLAGSSRAAQDTLVQCDTCSLVLQVDRVDSTYHSTT